MQFDDLSALLGESDDLLMSVSDNPSIGTVRKSHGERIEENRDLLSQLEDALNLNVQADELQGESIRINANSIAYSAERIAENGTKISSLSEKVAGNTKQVAVNVKVLEALPTKLTAINDDLASLDTRLLANRAVDENQTIKITNNKEGLVKLAGHMQTLARVVSRNQAVLRNVIG